ncbi:MAG TPA: hypothetical protein VJS12_02875 [Steroidobacteraceae bacterium]|nr:hypothetical protein [Steroidobacteraceae bacterium]
MSVTETYRMSTAARLWIGALVSSLLGYTASTYATDLSTCELIDSGSTLEDQWVAVKGHIHTDLMHFMNLESDGCSGKPVAMYFAEDSTFQPCRDAECPLNGVDYLIEGTFVGVYHPNKLSLHAKRPTLEVKDVQGMTRTPQRVVFERRVRAAKDLERTAAGKAYQDAMRPVVEPFLRNLIDLCTTGEDSDRTPFVWVATLTADGQPTNMQVEPDTITGFCFADGMQRAPFPNPPQEFANGLPVTFEIHVPAR